MKFMFFSLKVCRDIVNDYKNYVLAMPTTPDDWK